MYKKLLFIFVIIIFMIDSTIIFSNAGEIKTTKPGYIASISSELLNKTMQYAVDYDDVAFQKMLDTGFVFFLKEDVEVYIVERKIFSSIIKIRPAGETFEVWTLIEAVKDKN